MKKILYLLIVVSSVTFSCDVDKISENQAREFMKFYTNFPEFLAADVAVTEEGYAILGTAKTSAEESWICLLRTNEYGNSIDTARLYGLSSGSIANTAYCIKALEDGGFGILGSVLNVQTGNRSAYFVRTDGKGDTLFTRIISLDGDLEARYFDVSADESFYMTGYYDEPGKGHQIWWYGLDSQGNGIRNQRIFGFGNTDEGNHLSILPDGRLLISGFITDNDTTRSILIRTNANTLYVAHYESKPVADDETGNCVLPVNDNEYLLLSTSRNNSTSSLKLEKIQWNNPQADTVWTRIYKSNDNETGRRLVIDDQSIYVLATTSFNNSVSVISLIKTNLSGDEQSRMEFGSGSRLSPAAFEKTDDGGFIISGTNSNPEANNTSVALIKTR